MVTNTKKNEKPIAEEVEIINNLSKQHNSYYWQHEKGKEQVSNFILEGKYLLKHIHNPKRILTIRNNRGQECTISIAVKEMANINQFSSVVEGKGNFVISANRKQFNLIKEHEVFLVEKVATEITVLGYQKEFDFYAFSNGIYKDKFYEINDFGLVDIGDQTFFIPARSKINEGAVNAHINELKFKYKPSELSFEQWAKLVKTVYGINGMIGLSFVIASLFRDIVFYHLESFPLLFLFGPPETGKTTYTDSFLRLFGEPQTAISLGSASSPKGFARKLAQFSNGLIVFEEYKNVIKSSLIEMLKNIYNGIGYERAQMTNDNKTHSTPVLSSCIIPGQQLPTKENALFSRVILLEFDKKKHSNIAAYNELKEWEEKGLGNVIVEILSHRAFFKEHFKKCYNQIYNSIKSNAQTSKLSDRNIKKIATILSPIKLLSAKLSLPFDYKELYNILQQKILAQHEIMQKSNEVNVFWGIFKYLTDKDYYLKRGVDYMIKNEKGEERLYIQFKPVWKAYNDEAKKQDKEVLDEETLRHYLKMQNYFIPNSSKGKGDTFVKRDEHTRQRNYYCFDLKLISVEIA